jgi:S-adenosylmethionine decarboxylase
MQSESAFALPAASSSSVPEIETSSTSKWPEFVDPIENSVCKDHFISRDGVEFAGTHIIADFWDAHDLDDLDLMETALRDAAAQANATLLHIHLHHFTPNHGISGVAVLAESHISVHTWPERGFAAFDVFMCGDTHPENAIKVLERALKPSKVTRNIHLRGVVDSK